MQKRVRRVVGESIYNPFRLSRENMSLTVCASSIFLKRLLPGCWLKHAPRPDNTSFCVGSISSMIVAWLVQMIRLVQLSWSSPAHQIKQQSVGWVVVIELKRPIFTSPATLVYDESIYSNCYYLPYLSLLLNINTFCQLKKEWLRWESVKASLGLRGLRRQKSSRNLRPLSLGKFHMRTASTSNTPTVAVMHLWVYCSHPKRIFSSYSGYSEIGRTVPPGGTKFWLGWDLGGDKSLIPLSIA